MTIIRVKSSSSLKWGGVLPNTKNGNYNLVLPDCGLSSFISNFDVVIGNHMNPRLSSEVM